jgi:hypothetical protein
LERAFECGLDGAHPEVAKFAGSAAFDELMRLYGGRSCAAIWRSSRIPRCASGDGGGLCGVALS